MRDGHSPQGERLLDRDETHRQRRSEADALLLCRAGRSAILRASSGRRIGKVSAKSVVAGTVFPIEQECILLSAKTGKPLTSYKIHSCRAVVNKAGILRSRPMFEDWACDLALDIDTEMLPDIGIVTQLLNIAGRIIGVMDWRPEKMGTFGRFTAELVQ